jgi:predicted acyl esterase
VKPTDLRSQSLRDTNVLKVEIPHAITPGKALQYRLALPTANPGYLPGQRMMAPTESSWFPLYGRNPRTFVPNVFWAKPADYRKPLQRIYHAPGQASFIELPVVAAQRTRQ